MSEPVVSPHKRTSSLYGYLALVIFVCVAVPALVSGGVLIYTNFKRTIDNDSRIAAEGYGDVLQAGLSIPLWNLSPDIGQPILENVFVDPSVRSVVVVADNGRKFLEYQRNSRETEGDSLEVNRDIEYSGQKIGAVKLVYSVEKAHNQASKEAKLLAVIIALQLVFSLAAVSYLMHRRVLSPLKKLDQAAAGIARGDLRTTIPYLSNDELGSLAIRLEKMRGVLEESFGELEGRVDKRTAELQSTLDQLNKTKDDLIQSEKLAALGSLVAGVAHELNTPIGNGLTVASSLCDTCESFEAEVRTGLTRTALEKFKQDMTDGTQLVCRNLEKASELVSSFKQVAVDQTSAKRRTFELRAFLEETLLTASPIFKRTPYTVDLRMQDDVTMDSCPGPLGQVITNLLNNAIIHAFDGLDHGVVTVRVTHSDTVATIQVEDNGNGIAQENLAKIFDPFFTTKLGDGGNGLGMNIVHNIVTGVLGGEITLSSKLQQGTTVTVIIPLVAPEDAGVPSEPMDMVVGSNKLAS